MFSGLTTPEWPQMAKDNKYYKRFNFAAHRAQGLPTLSAASGNEA
jgi:hypothetical protein